MELFSAKENILSIIDHSCSTFFLYQWNRNQLPVQYTVYINTVPYVSENMLPFFNKVLRVWLRLELFHLSLFVLSNNAAVRSVDPAKWKIMVPLLVVYAFRFTFCWTFNIVITFSFVVDVRFSRQFNLI